MRFLPFSRFIHLVALSSLEWLVDTVGWMVFRKIYSWIESYCYSWGRMESCRLSFIPCYEAEK